MSKSLGNGIDPLEVIDKYGSDALRISLVLATPDGQDPWISKNTFEGGRNFINKMYQVSRFIMKHMEGQTPVTDKLETSDLLLFDRWILSRLDKTIRAVNRSIDEFRLSSAAKTLYNFVWDDYCSWYIELIKPDKQGEGIRSRSLDVAGYVLRQILLLLHPFVPFVTEEIGSHLTGFSNDDGAKTLVFGPWPTTDGGRIDEELEARLRQIQDVVTAVRSARAELNVPPGKKSDLYIKVSDETLGKLLEEHVSYFRSLARVENLHCGLDVKKPPLSASSVISGAEIYLPLEGLIDIDVERNRLQKDLDNIKTQLNRVSKKLANADFLNNAPGDVIEREKLKKRDYEERTERINKNLEQLMGW